MSAELTGYFVKSSNRSQAREAGARLLAGAMHDHATIVEPTTTMCGEALCVNIGSLVGALSRPIHGRECHAECDCCGATISSGWCIGRGTNQVRMCEFQQHPPCSKPDRHGHLRSPSYRNLTSICQNVWCFFNRAPVAGPNRRTAPTKIF